MTQLKRFDPLTASDAEFEAYTTFRNHLRAESDPDDPPVTSGYLRTHLSTVPPSIHLHIWTLWDEGEVVAASQFITQDREDNRHIGQADVEVTPNKREQGLSRALLHPLLDQARADAKTLLICDTTDRVPGGEAFVRHLGGRKGMASHINQLELSKLDHALMQSWREGADRETYEPVLWRDRVPDEHLNAFAELKDVMNTAPFEDLEIEDFKITPEHIRQGEAARSASGQRSWMLLARHRPSGTLAGYTETFWRPDNPAVLDQGDTGVLPAYRGQRLGRWLKASMLETVLADKPDLRFVRTGNADSNEAMLNINREMGFEPYKAITVWQLETDKLAAYLGAV